MTNRPVQGGSPGTWGAELNAWIDEQLTTRLIADQVVVGAAVNRISFPGIPQTFRNLRIEYSGRSNDGGNPSDDIDLTCNGDNFSTQMRGIYYEERNIAVNNWNGNPDGGVFTSTPGAVSTVSIPHGLSFQIGLAPQHFAVSAGNANARGAPPYYVTVTATDIVLNFASPLTAATSYTWNWMAIGVAGGYVISIGRTPAGLTSCIVGTVAAGTAVAGASGSGVIHIPNYTNSVFHKQFVCSGGYQWSYTNSDAGMDSSVVTGVAVRQDTAPITQIDLWGRVGNFVEGSRFTLYGS